MIIKPKKIEVVEFSQLLEVPDTVKPKAVLKDLKPSQECVTDIVDNWKSLTSEEINKAVADLFIKFNTSPKTYLKSDYLLLLHILKALADLHDTNIIQLVNSWDEVTSKSTLPGGVLLKETIKQEVEERKLADTDLYNSLFPLIAAGL